jgi:hypothetical protein
VGNEKHIGHANIYPGFDREELTIWRCVLSSQAKQKGKIRNRFDNHTVHGFVEQKMAIFLSIKGPASSIFSSLSVTRRLWIHVSESLSEFQNLCAMVSDT